MHLGKNKFRHILHVQVSTAFPPEKVGQARRTSSSMHACLSNFYSDSWDYPSFAPYAVRAEKKRSVSSVLLMALKLRRLKQKRTESSPGCAKNNLTPRRINSHASLQINRSTCEAIIFPLFLTTPVQFLSTFVSSKLGVNDIVFKIYIKCALNNYAASECSQQITRYEWHGRLKKIRILLPKHWRRRSGVSPGYLWICRLRDLYFPAGLHQNYLPSHVDKEIQ